MKNFVQHGGVLTVAAPFAVSSGKGVLVGALFGVAAFDAANGAPVEIKREGVFDLPVLGTDVAAAGDKAYWDPVNKRLTVSAGGNTLVGCFALAKAANAMTARVLLDGAIR